MSLQAAKILGAVGAVLLVGLILFSILYQPLILVGLVIGIGAIIAITSVGALGMDIAEDIWKRFH